MARKDISEKIKLSSSRSLRVSLEKIKCGKAGLSARRAKMLSRVPKTNDWARVERDSVSMKDIAFMTAKSGDEFAILKGKKEDILFHGAKYHCSFKGVLCEMLMSGQMKIYGHSHPAEVIPIPSWDDRDTLKKIGQKKSRLISAVSGKEVEFYSDEFQEAQINYSAEGSGFGSVDIE